MGAFFASAGGLRFTFPSQLGPNPYLNNSCFSSCLAGQLGNANRRTRFYIVGARLDGSITGDDATADEFFADVTFILQKLRTPPIPLSKLILPEDSAYLATELARRQQARAEQERRILENEIQKEACLKQAHRCSDTVIISDR